MSASDGRAFELRDWVVEAYRDGLLEPAKGDKEAARVRVERSPAQKANLAIFVRGLRAVEQHVKRVATAAGTEAVLVRPDFASWSILAASDVVVATLPRGAGELEWVEEGLRAVQAESGAALLAGLQGR